MSSPTDSSARFWRRPLDADRIRSPRGEVRILVDRCKGCEFCVEYCPRDVLALSAAFNRKGYHPPEVVKDGECVNCNLCEVICPEFAIYSVVVTEGSDGEIVESRTSVGVAT